MTLKFLTWETQWLAENTTEHARILEELKSRERAQETKSCALKKRTAAAKTYIHSTYCIQTLFINQSYQMCAIFFLM